jgi:transcription initiation factor TFIIH subunit 3
VFARSVPSDGRFAVSCALLGIMLDASTAGWSNRVDRLTLDSTLRAVMALIRAHFALSPTNELAFIVTTDAGAHVLFAPALSPTASASSSSSASSTVAVPLHEVEATINDGLRQLAHVDRVDSSDKLGTFAASLSQMLCIVNRFLRVGMSSSASVVAPVGDSSAAAAAAHGDRRRCARVLALQCAGDDATQYISTMNGIFCAQKLDVPIDACVLRTDDVSFLQQAASITGGVYVRPPLAGLERSLVQTLLLHFLPDNHARALLNMPQQSLVDMRASCVCHGTMLDIGFVCSVCLSIFCARSPICDTCGARFELPVID